MNDMLRLIEPLIPALRRYARALLREHAAADDLVQDCLERAITRWHQRHTEGDVRTWLFAILHNLAVNQLRRTASRGPHVPINTADDTAVARSPDQESGLRYRELLRQVAELPLEQSSVLLLVSVEDLSYAETARVLNIPIGTVMSRLSRAREKLAQELHADAGAAPVRHLRRIK